MAVSRQRRSLRYIAGEFPESIDFRLLFQIYLKTEQTFQGGRKSGEGSQKTAALSGAFCRKAEPGIGKGRAIK